MAALDVITLDEAKQWLVVDFEDDDAIIRDAIKASIGLIERYTNHFMWQRQNVVIPVYCSEKVYDYPLTILSVKDKNDVVLTDYCHEVQPLCTYFSGYYSVTANIGYASRDDVPSELIMAAKKMITYIYENRDTFEMELPADIQGMVNQLRRDASI